MLNMFWMLIHPSSGACDLCVELFCGLYWSGSMCGGVTLWYGYGGVVSVCRLKHYFNLHTDTTPPQPNHNVTPTHIEPDQCNPQNNSTHKSQATCWTLYKEIIKQVTSSWSLFTQLSEIYSFLLLIKARRVWGVGQISEDNWSSQTQKSFWNEVWF